MAAGDLCALSDVQTWLGNSTPAAEPILSQLITSASKAICNYTARGSFAEEQYVDTYDGTGRNWMLLRQWPVSSVSSIQIGLGSCAQTITDATTFLLEQPLPSGGNQRLILLDTAIMYAFPRGRSNVQVTYTAGYEQTPPDVAQACIEAVGEAYQRRTRIGQSSVTMKDQSTVSFSQADLNSTIKLMLASYRRLIPV